ncbi:hypothetical protein CC86DRAFT_384027 [Ophiobolus disseminans]|uniref:Uncharacterized protein n=1 Tax=Ophiobolus disseminans TaxID=1469910 RepID=A0A6A6ZVK6_9PLEO|nr:hypothetical protein CC86DRAFT_384027 [Ophiobolus disseminans]
MTIKGSFLAILSARDISALRPRDNVAECQAVLLFLKAAAFCSTFNGLKDATRTATGAGLLKTTTATVAGAPCTVTAERATITSMTTVLVSGPIITATTVLNALTLKSTSVVPTPTILSTTTFDASPIISTQVTTSVITQTTYVLTSPAPPMLNYPKRSQG